MEQITKSNFIKPLAQAASRAEKPFKHTLFQSSRLLVGLNCLDAGQRQGLHEHVRQDKFYLVLEGRGDFTVGEKTVTCGPGELIVAPAGIQHAVSNNGPERLSFITAIAPAV